MEMAELKALEQQATSAPWEVVPYGNHNQQWLGNKDGSSIHGDSGDPHHDPAIGKGDAQLIVALRNHAKELIAVVEAATGALNVLHDIEVSDFGALNESQQAGFYMAQTDLERALSALQSTETGE